MDTTFTILSKVDVILLLILGIVGVILSIQRRKAFPKASKYVGTAGWLLIISTGLTFANLVGHQYQAQCEFAAGALVIITIGVLFAAAYAFPNAGAEESGGA